MSWLELAGGVFARRHAELDLTTGLVLGRDRCLVIDTGGDQEQGEALAAAVREITPLPWTVVLTHAHYDHAYGAGAFLPADIWAHEGCRRALVEEKRNVLPGKVFTDRVTLDLGGREVRLIAFTPGHTDHDVVVHVPDASVVFAGDLVEFAPPGSFSVESFGSDTTLDAWPLALDNILRLGAEIVVPGHGDPVGREFTTAQREALLQLIRLRGLPKDEILARSPLAEDVTRAALGLG